MESNLWLDLVKILVGGGAIGAFSALIPYIIQFRKEKEEKAKLGAETSSIGADATQKIVTAAGNLQDAYVELINDMKSRTAEYKEEIHGLNTRLKEIEQSNIELRIKVDETNKQLEESKKLIVELVYGVKLLTQQVEELGQQPRYIRNE